MLYLRKLLQSKEGALSRVCRMNVAKLYPLVSLVLVATVVYQYTAIRQLKTNQKEEQVITTDALKVVDSLLTVSQDSIDNLESIIAIQKQEIKSLKKRMPLRSKLRK
jgi:hypothetical protein